MMWTVKYRPKKVEDVLGNPKVGAELKAYSWKKPAILSGPPGVGKSALALALAAELCLDIVEINDDNIANGKTIAETRSLFCDKKLVLIDNVEAIKDIKEVAEILKAARNPVLLLTSDYESKRLATVKKLCENFPLRKPVAASVAKLLGHICEAEGIEAEKEALTKIAENAGGDFRAAVNDLETIAGSRSRITLKDAGFLEARDSQSDIYRALSTIFFKKDIKESQRSTYDLDEQPANVLLWIDENLPAVVKGPGEIAACYEYLSRADVFLGRITNRQYWGFLRYAGTLMTAGVTANKGEKVNFTRYQFPFYIIRMGQSKKERNLKKNIGLKIGPYYHCSSKDAANEYIPLLRTLIEKKCINPDEMAQYFKLDDEEKGFLEGR